MVVRSADGVALGLRVCGVARGARAVTLASRSAHQNLRDKHESLHKTLGDRVQGQRVGAGLSDIRAGSLRARARAEGVCVRGPTAHTEAAAGGFSKAPKGNLALRRETNDGTRNGVGAVRLEIGVPLYR